jgi:integrase/recombinase XerC
MPAVMARNGGEGWRLEGAWRDVEVANRFLAHLVARAFSRATVRAYAYDLVNFGRFCHEQQVRIGDAVPTDFFDYLDWQQQIGRTPTGSKVVRLDRRRVAPATMNRGIAAVRGLFEFATVSGVRADNPVPAPRPSMGCGAGPRAARSSGATPVAPWRPAGHPAPPAA